MRKHFFQFLQNYSLHVQFEFTCIMYAKRNGEGWEAGKTNQTCNTTVRDYIRGENSKGGQNLISSDTSQILPVVYPTLNIISIFFEKKTRTLLYEGRKLKVLNAK